MRLTLLTLAVVGCGGAGSVSPGAPTPHGEVVSIAIGLRRDRPSVCPRQAVQIGVFADVIEGGARRKIETGTGVTEVNRPGGLDFAELRLGTSSGRLFRDGWLLPEADVLTTVDRDVTIDALYLPRPDVRAAATFGVDYRCITRAGGAGHQGRPGEIGARGEPGDLGLPFGARPPGSRGTGEKGGTGREGKHGGEGAAGPKLVAYATLVKTRRYDRLVAIWIDGDIQDFVLVHADAPITVGAVGGKGGTGGRGGGGGPGGAGGEGNGAAHGAGHGGRGGDGGTGGPGGAGGPGGTLEFVYDARFPELARQVQLDVAGGSGGDGGPAGSGGQGGFGGFEPPPPPPAIPKQKNSPAGSPGKAGPRGTDGPPGRASAKPGPVSLEPTPGLTPL